MMASACSSMSFWLPNIDDEVNWSSGMEQEEEAMLVSRVKSWNNSLGFTRLGFTNWAVSSCVQTVLMVTSLSPTCLSMIHQYWCFTYGGSDLSLLFVESAMVDQVWPAGVNWINIQLQLTTLEQLKIPWKPTVDEHVVNNIRAISLTSRSFNNPKRKN